LEQTLEALGGVANSIPGGQPVGVLLLGAASLAKIWRDKQTIRDAQAVAKTLAQARDSALDVIATLPDREQAQQIEEQINQQTAYYAEKLGSAKKMLDAILAEAETPTKTPVTNES
jgi:hypothetical protein